MELRLMALVRQCGVESLIHFMRGNVEYLLEECRRRVADLPDGTMRRTMNCREPQ